MYKIEAVCECDKVAQLATQCQWLFSDILRDCIISGCFRKVPAVESYNNDNNECCVTWQCFTLRSLTIITHPLICLTASSSTYMYSHTHSPYLNSHLLSWSVIPQFYKHNRSHLRDRCCSRKKNVTRWHKMETSESNAGAARTTLYVMMSYMQVGNASSKKWI